MEKVMKFQKWAPRMRAPSIMSLIKVLIKQIQTWVPIAKAQSEMSLKGKSPLSTGVHLSIEKMVFYDFLSVVFYEGPGFFTTGCGFLRGFGQVGPFSCDLD